MIIAVTATFGPDFDRILCFKIENGKIREREEVRCFAGADKFADQLTGLEVDLLLAGRIPRELETHLERTGVPLIRDLDGAPDGLVAAYLNGTLPF